MRSSNTFGVHFTLRNKEQNGKHRIYANKPRQEMKIEGAANKPASFLSNLTIEFRGIIFICKRMDVWICCTY